MTAVWYELEILSHNDAQTFYPIAIMNRSDANAGFDLFSSENVLVEQTPVLVPFGITVRLLKVEPMPNGMPRSSIYKSGLLMANSTGVIDKSYRGELKAPVWSMTGHSSVQVGDRLFQIVAPDMGWIRHVRLVDSLPDTERGAGGFGSTGK
jgi:dUTP pyrophosphatase